MEIFRLMGSIFIDNEKANKSIDDTDKKGKGVAGTLTSMVGTAAKWGAAIGAGAIVAGGAILALATKTGDMADRLLDLNSITGMSTDEIQKWERVTKVAGVNADAMTNASQKLTKSLNVMDKESNKSRKAIEMLGLSINDVNKMNADERMNALTQALAGVEDKTERAKIGTDLFGGSWKEIAPIVDLGTEAMNKAKDSANVFSEEDLKRANDMRIKFAEIKDQASFFAMNLGMQVIPIAEKFFEWVDRNMPMIQKIIGMAFEWIGIAIDNVTDAVAFFIDGFKGIGDPEALAGSWQSYFYKFGEAIDNVTDAVAFFIDGFKGIGDPEALAGSWQSYFYKFGEGISKAINTGIEWIGLFIAWINQWRTDNEEQVQAIIEKVIAFFEAFCNLITSFVEFATAFWDKYGQDIMDITKFVFGIIGDIIGFAFEVIVDIIGFALDLITEIFNIFAAIFRGDWESMWEGVSNIFKGIWNGIMAMLEKGINWAIGGLNRFIEQINKAIEALNKVPGVSFPFIPAMGTVNIPRLARGGILESAGSVIVGDDGQPEILDLPRGARVRPLDKTGGINFERGAFEGAIIMDDYGVDRLMDRIISRMQVLGARS